MKEEIVFCKYNQAEEKDYVWAGCSCLSRPDWGYKIKRTSLDRFVEFRCPQCQSQVSMFVPAKNDKTHCESYSDEELIQVLEERGYSVTRVC